MLSRQKQQTVDPRIQAMILVITTQCVINDMVGRKWLRERIGST